MSSDHHLRSDALRPPQEARDHPCVPARLCKRHHQRVQLRAVRRQHHLLALRLQHLCGEVRRIRPRGWPNADGICKGFFFPAVFRFSISIRRERVLAYGLRMRQSAPAGGATRPSKRGDQLKVGYISPTSAGFMSRRPAQCVPSDTTTASRYSMGMTVLLIGQ